MSWSRSGNRSHRPVLVGVGTFFAEATATGFVSRTAAADSAAASGIYLASDFAGGTVGSAVFGAAFDRHGWPAAVAGIGVVLALAAVLATRLRTPGALGVAAVTARPVPAR